MMGARRKMLRRVAGVVLGVVVPAWAGAAMTAFETIDSTSNRMLELIDQARGYVDSDRERFFKEVTNLLEPVVDFESFARSVMSVHYKDASDTQRARFAENFKESLVRTYALALLEFKDGEVVVLPPDKPSRSPKRESVKMEIRTNTGDVYPVIYTMALGHDDSWRMRNIIINGVNIGLTYRSQFASAVKDKRYHNLDEVIDAWTNVVASGDETGAAGEEELDETAQAASGDGV